MIPIELADEVYAYRRELPGGGYVAIDVHPARSAFWRARSYRGEVIVERRSVGRGDDHRPPVIARAAGNTVEEVVQALLPAARCNETIGAALLRMTRVAGAAVPAR